MYKTDGKWSDISDAHKKQVINILIGKLGKQIVRKSKYSSISDDVTNAHMNAKLIDGLVNRFRGENDDKLYVVHRKVKEASLLSGFIPIRNQVVCDQRYEMMQKLIEIEKLCGKGAAEEIKTDSILVNKKYLPIILSSTDWIGEGLGKNKIEKHTFYLIGSKQTS